MTKRVEAGPVGENLAEHLLDLVGGGVGPADMFPDPGEPGYKEVTWTRAIQANEVS